MASSLGRCVRLCLGTAQRVEVPICAPAGCTPPADAIEELQLDQLGAIETLVDALGDQHERQFIIMGMILRCHHDPGQFFRDDADGSKRFGIAVPETVDVAPSVIYNLHTQLSEELERMEEGFVNVRSND